MASYNSDNYTLTSAEPPVNVDSSKLGGRVRCIIDGSDDSGVLGIGEYASIGIVPAGFKLVSIDSSAGTFDIVSLDSAGAETKAASSALGYELPEGDVLALKASAAPAGAWTAVVRFTALNS